MKHSLILLAALLLAPFTALPAADAPKPMRPNNLALDSAHASIRKELFAKSLLPNSTRGRMIPLPCQS